MLRTDAAASAARLDAVRLRAQGRWSEILPRLGVDPRWLSRRNQPCPRCGGTDRYQYTDKFGEGNYHCRHCGPGGGFKLLQATTGMGFARALREVEACVGLLPLVPAATAQAPAPSSASMKQLVQRIWDEAAPVTSGDAVDRYLRGRGLALPVFPAVLRFHPALGYYAKDEAGRSRRVAEYPAMLACIQGPDGQAVTLHRTYLDGGGKLHAADAKKVLSGGLHGAAVRLYEPGEGLAIAEGIETALALHLATGKPVWAGLNAGNLDKLWLPAGLRRVDVYADNDADGDFAGQCAAFALARRLRREGNGDGDRQVRVFVPRHAGADWADVWCRRSLITGAPG
jgi:putative DNA primase/helicase